VENRTERARALSIVLTGEFGIAGPETVANDVVYANLVQESEVEYAADGSPVCLTMHHKPADQQGEKKFALLLSEGETMDAFSASLPDFIGTGTLAEPEQVLALPSRPGTQNGAVLRHEQGVCAGAGRGIGTSIPSSA
jgi:hypothetical protein